MKRHLYAALMTAAILTATMPNHAEADAEKNPVSNGKTRSGIANGAAKGPDGKALSSANKSIIKTNDGGKNNGIHPNNSTSMSKTTVAPETLRQAQLAKNAAADAYTENPTQANRVLLKAASNNLNNIWNVDNQQQANQEEQRMQQIMQPVMQRQAMLMEQREQQLVQQHHQQHGQLEQRMQQLEQHPQQINQQLQMRGL